MRTLLLLACLLFPGWHAQAQTPQLLAEVRPGVQGSEPNNYISFDTVAFFVAAAPNSPLATVWRTDGTAAGTYPLISSGPLAGAYVSQLSAVRFGPRFLLGLSVAGNGPCLFLTYGQANDAEILGGDSLRFITGLYKLNQHTLIARRTGQFTLHSLTDSSKAIVRLPSLLNHIYEPVLRKGQHWFGRRANGLFSTNGQASGTNNHFIPASTSGRIITDFLMVDTTLAYLAISSDSAEQGVFVQQAGGWQKIATAHNGLFPIQANALAYGQHLFFGLRQPAEPDSIRIMRWRPGQVQPTFLAKLPYQPVLHKAVGAAGYLWFPAHTAAEGRELWRMDTATGQLQQTISTPGWPNGMDAEALLVVADSVLLFQASDSTTGREWRRLNLMSGQVAALSQVSAGSVSGVRPVPPVRLGSQWLFTGFTTAGSQPYLLDATTGQNTLVKTLSEGYGPLSSMTSYPNSSQRTVFGFSNDTSVVMNLWDEAEGWEPWRISRSRPVPHRFARTAPGPDHGWPGALPQAAETPGLTVEGTTYFSYYRAGQGWRLVAKAGPETPEQLLASTDTAGNGETAPYRPLARLGSWLVVHHSQGGLWGIHVRTGQRQLIALASTNMGSLGHYWLRNYHRLIVNQSIYSAAPQSVVLDSFLVATNFTDSLSQPVSAAGSLPPAEPLALLQGKHIVALYSSPNLAQFFVTDGSPQGTRFLTSVAVNTFGTSLPHKFKPFRGKIYFGVSSGQGFQIWSTDGTAAGTQMHLAKTQWASSIGGVGELVVFKNKLWFLGTYLTDSVGLFSNDGLGETCELIGGAGREINMSDALYASPDGQQLYYTAYTTATGVELWRSNGTKAGTGLFADLNPGPASSFPDVKMFGDSLLVMAYLPTYGREFFLMQPGAALSSMALQLGAHWSSTGSAELRWNGLPPSGKAQLERSVANRGFQALGPLMALQNSSDNGEYLDVEAGLLPDQFFHYRLSIHDPLGQIYYSSVAALRKPFFAQAMLTPNPAQHTVRLQWRSAEAALAQVVVFNAEGQMVQQQKVQAPAGQNQLILSLHTLASGSYRVVLQAGSNVESLSLIKR